MSIFVKQHSRSLFVRHARLS